jgi:prepilin-type N-terminal cleavage/methylation domain-containing protein
MTLTFKTGFTLIEILTVVGIIAIVATISFPVYQNMRPNITLNAAARDLATDMRYGQQLAVTEQIVYNIIFNTSASSYEIRNGNTDVLLRNKILPSGVTFLSITGLTDNIARFTATGAATESGTIILTNRKNKQSTIEIKPSGYVKISN